MRCSSCGLPLSPTRSQCPRCGTAAGSGKKEEQRSNNQSETLQQAFPDNNMPMGTEGQPPANNEMQNQMAPAGLIMGQSFDQANVPRSPAPDSFYKNDPAPLSQPGGIYPHASGVDRDTFSPQYPQPYSKLSSTPSTTSARIGLTVASLCVLTGGFILMLVYIISVRLPPVSIASQTNLVSATAQVTIPVQTPIIHTTPRPTSTPTQTLPGQQFVDNVQLASSVNVNTAQPLQLTTNFLVNQQIFVTFMLHPGSNGGAVCLQWYINQTQFSHFAFLAGATPESAYSFAYAGNAGQGSVQIYWANSLACTDKMLARVATFTVG